MTTDKTRMIDDLHALGVREGGVLMVHSSLRSLGPVDGGAETIIEALLGALGPGGTLLLPALSYENVHAGNPYFDVRHTPSCVGALAEYFRLRAGTRRSIHPTHSVSGVGALAAEILSGQENDQTPCGPNSAWHRLPHYDGQILFLGCGMRPNTSMHAVEELSEPPYLFKAPVTYEMTDAAGRVWPMTVRRHAFDDWEHFYDRVAGLLDDDALHTGRVLAADCQLIESPAMWRAASAQLKAEPLYFVERLSPQHQD